MLTPNMYATGAGPASAMCDFVPGLAMNATDAGTPASLLAVADTHVTAIPLHASFLAIDAQCDAATLSAAPVVEYYGVDDASNITPLLNAAGDRQITFNGDIVLVSTGVYKIAEKATGQYLLDVRGARKVVTKRITAAAGGNVTLLHKTL